MKKLTIFFLSFILLLTVFACAGGQSTVTNRGTLSVAYDNAKTADLLGYFQANQNVIVTGTLLNDETDYETLTAAVALVKDIVVAEKLPGRNRRRRPTRPCSTLPFWSSRTLPLPTKPR